MTYGYIRVSTDKQDLENQKHEILNYSNNKKLGNVEFIEETIKNLEKQIDELEKNMSEIVKEKASETYKCLKSIPGIGSLSAIELIIVTKNFENFTSYKQLSAYIGLCPRITESGTSVKGKSSIAKMGMSYTRQLLYMC